MRVGVKCIRPDLLYLEISKKKFDTVDVVYKWKYGGTHILDTNKMKLCVYNACVL